MCEVEGGYDEREEFMLVAILAGMKEKAKMNKLILALPSKGRLEELSREVFGKAGMVVDRAGGARSYAGSLAGHDDVIVRFLPAGEIAKELIKGSIDIGITGTDLIHETIEDGAKAV